jgi:hypothetical protein
MNFSDDLQVRWFALEQKLMERFEKKPGVDEDGWPHFRQLKAMPEMNPFEQENFLKDHILLYFQNHNF